LDIGLQYEIRKNTPVMRVADGREGLQIWRADANMNKE
jgi:hypothetical protein